MCQIGYYAESSDGFGVYYVNSSRDRDETFAPEVCRLGLATVSLSVLLAVVLMAIESLTFQDGGPNRSVLVSSALMGLLVFATIVYNLYGTVRSLNSYSSFDGVEEIVVGAAVYLTAVCVSFIGWVCDWLHCARDLAYSNCYLCF